MGSWRAVLLQCLALAALVGIVTFAAPADARLWVLACGAAALAFFLGVTASRHRQIKRLAQEIDEVLHSGRAIDFSNCREGDVAVLSNELAKMVAQLARTNQLLEHERNALADALADISHQIRTPLTAAALMVPMIERAEGAEERKRLGRELESLLDRMAWLIVSLLKIAKVDAGAIQVSREEVPVADLVRQAAQPLATALDLHGVRLEVDVPNDVAFEGDGRWSAEALENIIKNCMEHTPAGGAVIVSAREDALSTSVTVRDTGAGIAAEDLPHIFERFYRGERADDAQTAGFGIGLALAQALISVQGGTLSAANGPEGGALFQIAFPKTVV